MTGPTGQSEEVVAFIDTGFNGSSILPPDSGRLVGRSSGKLCRRSSLADGELHLWIATNATVVWDGQPREVFAYAMGVDPLVRWRSSGHRLTIDAVDGGSVTIGPIA